MNFSNLIFLILDFQILLVYILKVNIKEFILTIVFLVFEDFKFNFTIKKKKQVKAY